MYKILLLLFMTTLELKTDGLNSPIYNLRINHLKDPFGIDIKNNIFSFLSEESGPFKASILLDDKIIQTKSISLNESISFAFDEPLEYNKVYKYIVESSSSKSELSFETALKLEAAFIKPKNKDLFSPIFFKDFKITKEIKKARLYITGLGLYQALINGKKVGNAYLTPGFNDYDYYLRYQTYDISELLQEENNIEIHMGDGWYKGRIGFVGNGTIYGNEYKLCLNLVIEYKDNSILNILSDESWRVKSSKEVSNSIYDGETVNYSLIEKPSEEVIISEENYNLIPDFGSLIVEHEILKPELIISPKGENILDFKQNMVGFVRFKGFLEKNQKMIMRHGDEGLKNVNPEEFEGVVIYTNLERVLECKTDNKKINQLIKNAYWGQRGNFLDVPTDCPQRDERMGWTADTQVFVNTACYNMDSYIFYKKYMNDLRGDQILYYKGDLPPFSPSLKHHMKNIDGGGAVWADAATIIPWNVYLNYGDKYLLNYFYPMMKEYVEVLINRDKEQGNKSLILEGFNGGTDNGFIMSVYYYHSVELTISAAKELGYNEDYEKYTEVKNRIYEAILNKYFYEDGRLNLNTQTSYVLCLKYNIYKNKELIIQDFKKRIKEDLYRIKTGFTGSPLILLTLFDNGMDEYAYRILYNEQFPGWIYAINLGATTIWERWNSLLEDGTVSGTGMNSFNHYQFVKLFIQELLD